MEDAGFLDSEPTVIMMKIGILTGLLGCLVGGVTLLSGCAVVGPWKHRGNPVRIDQRGRSMAEQHLLERDRLAAPLPDAGPTTEFERPGVHGR